MGIVFANNALTTLASQLNTGDTTATVTDLSLFPTLAVDDYYYATIISNTTREIVKVTAHPGGNDITIERAQDGTSPQQFPAGSTIDIRVTAQVLNELNTAALADLPEDTKVYGLTGANIDYTEVPEEAPNDGSAYLRKSEAWEATESVPSTVDSGKVLTSTGSGVEWADPSSEGSLPSVPSRNPRDRETIQYTHTINNVIFDNIATSGAAPSLLAVSSDEYAPADYSVGGSGGSLTSSQLTYPSLTNFSVEAISILDSGGHTFSGIASAKKGASAQATDFSVCIVYEDTNFYSEYLDNEFQGVPPLASIEIDGSTYRVKDAILADSATYEKSGYINTSPKKGKVLIYYVQGGALTTPDIPALGDGVTARTVVLNYEYFGELLLEYTSWFAGSSPYSEVTYNGITQEPFYWLGMYSRCYAAFDLSLRRFYCRNTYLLRATSKLLLLNKYTDVSTTSYIEELDKEVTVYSVANSVGASLTTEKGSEFYDYLRQTSSTADAEGFATIRYPKDTITTASSRPTVTRIYGKRPVGITPPSDNTYQVLSSASETDPGDWTEEPKIPTVLKSPADSIYSTDRTRVLCSSYVTISGSTVSHGQSLLGGGSYSQTLNFTISASVDTDTIEPISSLAAGSSMLLDSFSIAVNLDRKDFFPGSSSDGTENWQFTNNMELAFVSSATPVDTVTSGSFPIKLYDLTDTGYIAEPYAILVDFLDGEPPGVIWFADGRTPDKNNLPAVGSRDYTVTIDSSAAVSVTDFVTPRSQSKITFTSDYAVNNNKLSYAAGEGDRVDIESINTATKLYQYSNSGKKVLLHVVAEGEHEAQKDTDTATYLVESIAITDSTDRSRVLFNDMIHPVLGTPMPSYGSDIRYYENTAGLYFWNVSQGTSSTLEEYFWAFRVYSVDTFNMPNGEVTVPPKTHYGYGSSWDEIRYDGIDNTVYMGSNYERYFSLATPGGGSPLLPDSDTNVSVTISVPAHSLKLDQYTEVLRLKNPDTFCVQDASEGVDKQKEYFLVVEQGELKWLPKSDALAQATETIDTLPPIAPTDAQKIVTNDGTSAFWLDRPADPTNFSYMQVLTSGTSTSTEWQELLTLNALDGKPDWTMPYYTGTTISNIIPPSAGAVADLSNGEGYFLGIKDETVSQIKWHRHYTLPPSVDGGVPVFSASFNRYLSETTVPRTNIPNTFTSSNTFAADITLEAASITFDETESISILAANGVDEYNLATSDASNIKLGSNVRSLQLFGDTTAPTYTGPNLTEYTIWHSGNLSNNIAYINTVLISGLWNGTVQIGDAIVRYPVVHTDGISLQDGLENVAMVSSSPQTFPLIIDLRVIDSLGTQEVIGQVVFSIGDTQGSFNFTTPMPLLLDRLDILEARVASGGTNVLDVSINMLATIN